VKYPPLIKFLHHHAPNTVTAMCLFTKQLYILYPHVGHILKMLLIFFLIMNIMLQYKYRLDDGSSFLSALAKYLPV